MTTTIWAHINCMPIDVAHEMVVAEEARHLLSRPDGEHLRTAGENLFNSIPVHIIKHARRDNILNVVMFTSNFISPVSSDGTLIRATTIQTNHDIFAGKKPVDVAIMLHGPAKRLSSQMITVTVKDLSWRHLRARQVAVQKAMHMIHFTLHGASADQRLVVTEHIRLALIRRKRTPGVITMVHHTFVITAKTRGHRRANIFAFTGNLH
eukprot:scaffold53356_cov47-Cyclotella_meneghiniana.AAC.11